MTLPSLLLSLLLAGNPGGVTPPALEAPLELPTALPARRDLPQRILIELTISADGDPMDLRVVSDSPPELAEIALRALSAAKFRPATQGGVPIAVRITAPVTLGASTPLMRFARRALETPPIALEGISGRVLERGTRRVVPGVSVMLDGPDPVETLTDEDGRFVFPELPIGRYLVRVPFFDDDSAEARLAVRPGAPSEVTLRITPGAIGEYVTRVADDRDRLANSARIQVSMERAREVPGSSGDPLKVIESLPGIARPAAAGPGAGQLIIRGSAPGDNRFYIDGLPLFQLFHFGNIFSVVQDEWISDIDFRPGGYSTQFGDAIGGIVNVGLKELDREGVRGHGDINIFHAAGLVTVPVSDEWTLGVAARRSWVDAILGSIVGGEDSGFRFSTAPRYYDYQVRADYHPKDGPLLKLLVFGSDDDLVVLGGSPSATDTRASDFALSRSFHQIQGTLAWPLSRNLILNAGLATSYQQLRVSPGSTDFRLTFDPLITQADLDWRPSSSVRVRGGVYTEITRFKVDVALPAPGREGEVQLPSELRDIIRAREEGFSGRADLWGEATWDINDSLGVLGGVRLATWHGNFSAFAPDARVAVGYAVNKDLRVTLSGGLNHQAPAPDESAPSTGSLGLGPVRAAYLNLSVAQDFGRLLSVELQGFYKALDNLVAATNDFEGPRLDNAGTGTIYGGEALIRLQHPIVDAWIAYTLSRSLRQDRPDQPTRLFSFDQTHVLALVAGVQLGRGWRFGARFRYATGNPFTPLEAAFYDAGSDVWVPRAAAAPLSQRTMAFYQLDLRIDKTFIFDAWRLNVFLEVNNTTNRANIEAIGYTRDFRNREDITSLPLTPSIGVRGSF